MTDSLTIRDLRAELNLTLEEFALRIGVKSRGYASMIERGGPCSVVVALAIEELSGGRIPAAVLSPDVALVDAARSNQLKGAFAREALAAEADADLDHPDPDSSVDSIASPGTADETSSQEAAA